MPFRCLPLVFLVGLLSTGCGGTAPCPPGSTQDAQGRCIALPGDLGVPDAAVPDGALLDAAVHDAGAAELGPADLGPLPDASPDHGSPDASDPCGSSCSPTTVCEPTTATCVDCLVDTHCPSTTPRCDTENRCVACLNHADCPTGLCQLSSGRCVECLTNESCRHLAASRCEPATQTCAPCGSDSDCAHIVGRTVCIDGQCGPCHPTEGLHCGDYSCSELTLQCTDNRRGWTDLYGECEASSECTWGPCVRQAFVGPDHFVCTGSHYPTGCGSLPLYQLRPSIHGELVDFCALRENWLTYEAALLWVHYFRVNLGSPTQAGYRCTRNSDCPFGTFCREMHFFGQDENTRHCAVTGCTSNAECPSGLVCRPGTSGEPSHCAVWRF